MTKIITIVAEQTGPSEHDVLKTSYKKPASKCLHSLSCSGQVVSCKRH